MNLLPFVAIFLILLASLSYSSLDKGKTLHYEKEAALGYMRAERNLLNTLQRDAYKKIPKKRETSSPKPIAEHPSSAAKNASNQNPHTIKRGSTLIKMNLAPLFQNPCPPILSSTFLTLLKTYYGQSSFVDPKTLDPQFKSFIKHFIEQGKDTLQALEKEKQPLSSLKLSQLYPKQPSEKHLFYKMLKGTHIYSLDKREGYPPFEEVFCVEEKKPLKILHFPSLPPLMLEALFGVDIAKHILEKEASFSQDKARLVHTLSEQELLDLIHQKFPSAKDLEQLITLLDFSVRHKKKEKITARDEITAIQIEKQLSPR